MRTKHHLSRWLPVALAAALCLGAVALCAAEAPSPQARAMALTWKLIANVDDARQDPSALALSAFDLPADEAGRLRALGRQQATERERLIEQLSKTYAGKVRQALDAAQRARYDAVMAALDRLSEAESAARDAFIKTAGLTADQADALPAGYVPTSDLTRYLDVDAAARDRVHQIQADADSTREKALIEGMDPATWQDVASWRKHREAYAKAQKQAQEQYDKQLAAVLTPDQVKKLKALETAAEQYRKSLDAARQEAYQKLHAALQPPATTRQP